MSQCIRCDSPLEWPKDKSATLGNHVIVCPVCGAGNIIHVYSGKGVVVNTIPNDKPQQEG